MTKDAAAAAPESIGNYAKVEDLSLRLLPGTTLPQAGAVLASFGHTVRGHRWWIGDCVCQMEDKWGEEHAQYIDGTGLDESSLTNCVWVAKKIPPDIRRPQLSWSHHAEVAGCDTVKAMDTWLGRAVKHKWTTKELAAQMRGEVSEAASTLAKAREKMWKLKQVEAALDRGLMPGINAWWKNTTPTHLESKDKRDRAFKLLAKSVRDAVTKRLK